VAGKSSSSERSNLGKAFLFSVICIVLVMFLAPPELPRTAMDQERLTTMNLAGTTVEHDIHVTAQNWYETLVDRKKWHAGARDVDLPLVNQERLARYLDNRVEATAALVEIGLYRLSGLWIWLMVALPLLAATAVDAAMTREVRKHQFRYTSHTLQFAAGSSIGWLVVLITAGAFIPYPIPYVFSAVLAIPLGWMIWSWIANMPKRL